jgi:transcriptional regulator with XRE-family HTH domain
MKRDYEPFNARLSRIRTERSLTAYDLRVATGMTLAAVKDYESGARIPGYIGLRLLATHLDVSADYLAGLTEEGGRLQRGAEVTTRFSDRLKLARAERGLSQDDLADLVKTSRTRIGRWESGTLPSFWSLVEIAVKCKVSLDWLLGLSERMTTD